MSRRQPRYTTITTKTPLWRIKIMKKLIAKIARLLNPVYQVVYKTKAGTTAMYTITKPKHSNEFGNSKEGLAVAGLKLIATTEMEFARFATIELYL